MAHDFGIIKNGKDKGWAFFFGYAGGLMYRVFGEEKHNAILSGDNGKEVKSKAETEKALDMAIEKFDRMNYPDRSAMDDIKQFREKMKNDSPKDEYIIWYS